MTAKNPFTLITNIMKKLYKSNGNLSFTVSKPISRNDVVISLTIKDINDIHCNAEIIFYQNFTKWKGVRINKKSEVTDSMRGVFMNKDKYEVPGQTIKWLDKNFK